MSEPPAVYHVPPDGDRPPAAGRGPALDLDVIEARAHAARQDVLTLVAEVRYWRAQAATAIRAAEQVAAEQGALAHELDRVLAERDALRARHPLVDESAAPRMTEAERTRAQRYIGEVWDHLSSWQVTYALAYLDTLGSGPPPDRTSLVTDAEAAALEEAVEALLLDLRTPGFDQDDWRTL